MSSKKRIRVLVVDDSALMRKLLTNMLEAAQDIEVVGTAVDGNFALSKIETLRPDVVTLDLDMPRMDGLTALKEIVNRHALPVVLVSSYTERGAAVTFEALAAGAVDFVTKPQRILSVPLDALGRELTDKIRVAAGVRVHSPGPKVEKSLSVAEAKSSPPSDDGADYALVIGASTGGPNALSYLLPQLRPDFGAAVLVVQHMPEHFTALFARHLADLCPLDVKEATNGAPIVPGQVLVAPGGSHLKVQRIHHRPAAVLSKSALVHGMRPSVDVLFQSAGEAFKKRTIGLIMTGMGEDGAAGCGSIRAAGGRTLAQDRQSSVVFGMPKAAIDRQAIQKVLPLADIAPYLNSLDLGRPP